MCSMGIARLSIQRIFGEWKVFSGGCRRLNRESKVLFEKLTINAVERQSP